jgi:GrpB-like predicted nucleotidyltransferase (UPF0157 family)
MIETKIIEVVEYDQEWPKLFLTESKAIAEVLGNNLIAIYHVGSTSIPGMLAKPIIDIIGVVKNICDSPTPLESIGYLYKGEWNIPFKYSFSKRSREIKVNLHIYEASHPEIELNLIFRDKIKEDIGLFEEYKQLKIALLQEPSSFQKNNSIFTGYNLGKDLFIRKALKLAGYSGTRFLRCAHIEEWKTVENILRLHNTSISKIKKGGDHHFILTIGITVVAYAYLEHHKADNIKIFSAAGYEYSRDILKNMVEKWKLQCSRDEVATIESSLD